MSKIFFDQFIILDDIEKEIRGISVSNEEKEELWEIVDDIVQHRLMDVFLKYLPLPDHSEFLEKFEEAPYDDSLSDLLTEKIGKDVREVVKEEMKGIKAEIISTLKEEIKENKE